MISSNFLIVLLKRHAFYSKTLNEFQTVDPNLVGTIQEVSSDQDGFDYKQSSKDSKQASFAFGKKSEEAKSPSSK